LKNGRYINLFSRQGQPILGLVDIEYEALQHMSSSFVLDGELLINDTGNLSSAEQYKATSKIVRKDGEKHGIAFRAFDLLTLDEFMSKKCKNQYRIRRNMLETLFKDGTLIQPLPSLYTGIDTSMIGKLLDKVRDEGQEGLMVNICDAEYEFKRSQKLLKVKVMQDADLLVTGIYEGTGKHAGRLGGIEIEFEHEGQRHRCNCGSGFSDDEREKYFEQPELIVGKIATIKFFEISRNDKGGYGLRFPIWLGRIRDDKTEVSMK